MKIEGSYTFKREKYDRRAIIASVIINKKIINKNVKYLEIGCDLDGTFNSIPLSISDKIGVDPKRGGTHRMTSDQFFENNNDKFDVIFIDGLHLAQCKKDFLNSLEVLNEEGVIFFDDMLPLDWAMQYSLLLLRHRVVSWKLAAEIKLSVSREALVIPSNIGL